MQYNNKLGIWGNLQKLFTERNRQETEIVKTDGTVTNLVGENHNQGAEQFRKAMQMFANSLDEESAMEIATVFENWEVGKAYKLNQYVVYGKNAVDDPQLYKVLQDHTSQEDWTPDVATSLFKAVGISPSGYPEWSQPVGADDAYNEGDIVSYKEQLYRSLINGNVWSPEAYPQGWELFVEE